MSQEIEIQLHYDPDYKRPTLTEERNHPNHWFNRASDLHASAGAVWYSMRSGNNAQVTEELGLGKGFSMSVACDPVYHMLCGQALEVIMKAVIVSRGETVPEVHHLNDLADLVGVERNVNEKRMLRFYEESIWWAGRYPIPKKSTDQKLKGYWNLANEVLTKPKKSEGTSLNFRVASGATNWEKFHALWLTYAHKFHHQY